MISCPLNVNCLHDLWFQWSWINILHDIIKHKLINIKKFICFTIHEKNKEEEGHGMWILSPVHLTSIVRLQITNPKVKSLTKEKTKF